MPDKTLRRVPLIWMLRGSHSQEILGVGQRQPAQCRGIIQGLHGVRSIHPGFADSAHDFLEYPLFKLGGGFEFRPNNKAVDVGLADDSDFLYSAGSLKGVVFRYPLAKYAFFLENIFFNFAFHYLAGEKWKHFGLKGCPSHRGKNQIGCQ